MTAERDRRGAVGFPVRYVVVAACAALLAACADSDCGSATPVTADLAGDPIRIASAVVSVEVDRTSLRIAVRERATGELLTRQPERGGLAYERGEDHYELTAVQSAREVEGGADLVVETTEGATAAVRVRFLTARTIEVELTPPEPDTLTAVAASWESAPDELIYGLTERLRDSPVISDLLGTPEDDLRPREVGSLDRRGETVEMFIRPTFSLYAPFYQSSRGYGLSVAGTMPGVFDIANSDPGVLSFRFATGTRPENRRLTFHVFVGPEHAAILDEYTALTGRPFVPPDWAFLNWRWRDVLDTAPPADLDGTPVNAQVAEDVAMFEQLGIPPGVYLFDRPVLAGNFGFARFAWDEQRLPHPEAMLAALRRRGYRIAMWSAAWACGSEPGDNGAEALALGFLAPGPDGDPICGDVGGGSFILDVTSAEARRWFTDKIAAFARRYGIDAVKLDRGEEHIASRATDIWADGRNGREVHNDYVILQTALHHDALAAAHPDGDFALITRSGYTGAQPYAVFWGGDIAGSESFGGGPGTDLGLRSAIISQQRAAFMGFPIWGSDTGGYYQFKDREVFARWIEFSAFSGIMEIGGKGTHAPWDMPTEPNYDEEMIGIYRRYTRLRETLQAYIVAAAREAGESGLPVVRPMVFLDREDPELRDRWDQYMFGPDLMVAPVWRSGARSRDVYFPRGTWRSYWNDTERYDGPATVTISVPLDAVPVFVRGGARVPRPAS